MGAWNLRWRKAQNIAKAKRISKRDSNSAMNMDEQPDKLLGLFCRHIISLSWLDAKREPDSAINGIAAYDPMVFSVSAFVISIRQNWFLITAGHVLRDLDMRLVSGRRIVKSRLMDGFASAPSYPAIPFSLGETPQWYVYADGLDYAVIPLRPAYVSQLLAGGVMALDEGAYTDLPESFDAYFLVGFPKQASEIAITSNQQWGSVSVNLGTPLLPVEPTDDPPRVLRRNNERFYAHVPVTSSYVNGKAITLTDIDGMSGGPIFGVKMSGKDKLRYWVSAVQSGWEPKSRVLAACPIRPLLDAITTYIDKHCEIETGSTSIT